MALLQAPAPRQAVDETVLGAFMIKLFKLVTEPTQPGAMTTGRTLSADDVQTVVAIGKKYPALIDKDPVFANIYYRALDTKGELVIYGVERKALARTMMENWPGIAVSKSGAVSITIPLTKDDLEGLGAWVDKSQIMPASQGQETQVPMTLAQAAKAYGTYLIKTRLIPQLRIKSLAKLGVAQTQTTEASAPETQTQGAGRQEELPRTNPRRRNRCRSPKRSDSLERA